MSQYVVNGLISLVGTPGVAPAAPLPGKAGGWDERARTAPAGDREIAGAIVRLRPGPPIGRGRGRGAFPFEG
jgi:hypothetical protein